MDPVDTPALPRARCSAADSTPAPVRCRGPGRRPRRLLDLRTGPGDPGDPDHPGHPRLPRRPPRPAPGGRPAARHAPHHAGPAGLRRLRRLRRGPAQRGAATAGSSASSWRPSDSARTRCCWAIRSARSSPATSWQTTPAAVSPLILINPIAAPALEGPKGLMTKLAVLYYEAAARLPRRPGQALLRSQLIVRVMSETMAKTRDKDVRRFVHAQHNAYFSAFADRDSLLESFKASVRQPRRRGGRQAHAAGAADRRREG